MKRLVMRQGLQGDLCIGLAVEFHKDCAELFHFTILVFGLQI